MKNTSKTNYTSGELKQKIVAKELLLDVESTHVETLPGFSKTNAALANLAAVQKGQQ